jgi:uncharacterized protein (DUF1800 family)
MSRDLLEPWRPDTGEWNRAAAAHLFRRAGFGAAPQELERALARGPEAALAELFADRGAPELRESVRQLLATGSLELLQAWWMSLILDGGAPLRERMVLLWHGHFATSNAKVDDVRLMHGQNELLRSGGLGDFRALLHAIVRDPAMLVWLDGDSNRSGHPNENLARELLELFALGIGNYAESDIREAARALSGWGTEGRSFVSRPHYHDAGRKLFLGQEGCWDGDDVVDLVLEHPACSRHVARVLLEAFVAPAAEPAWIEALAAALREHEWHIGRVLEILLSSRLFFSPLARRSRIAGPVELLAVSTRTLEARIAPRLAAELSAELGQALFRPPSVKGWAGGRAWINSGSWIARHNALERIAAADGTSGGEVQLDLARVLGDDPALLPERALAALLPEGGGRCLEQALERIARSSEDPARKRTLVAALVLTAPEYHLF